jgi:hypothetical protein
MKRVEQKISPAGYARLHESMLRALNEGYGDDAAARIALVSVGLNPKDFTETVFVVDHTLDGPCYPFMDWPEGWDKNDKATWK